MIRIGLPKGVVKSRSIELVKQLLGNDIDEKRMSFSVGNYQIFLLKHRDIPVFLDRGWLDFGITSSEWVLERGIDLETIATLDWCDARISLLGYKLDTKADITGTCVTEFPNIAKSCLKNLGYNDIEIHSVSGSCEGMVPEIFDFCIDCVETGETSRANELIELKCLLETKTVAVCKKNNIHRGESILKILFEEAYL